MLRSQECVILPGIGAFLRTCRPAVFSQDGSLSAPRMQVCFNSSIVSSDGMLAHSVARRNQISFEQASVLVSNAAEECRQALLTNRELTIGKLGRLCLDKEERISFEPFASAYKSVWANVSFIPQPHGNGLQHDASSLHRDTNRPLISDKDYYILRISRKAVRYVAIATVFLLTAATLLLPSANRNNLQDAAQHKQYASVVPGVEKLSVSYSEEKVKIPTAAPAAKPTITDNAVAITAGDKKAFYLIVATFSKEEDCKKFIEVQSDREELAIVTAGKVSRVYSAADNSRDELLKIMNSDTHKSLHPQAWIWSNPSVSL
ncbi:MAG: hypothetical protein NC402_07815 [Prevotella sp.]|nr:hypothetical protein [Prevotella sp.]MCM1075608.1 hypothetical protein [Ruminococcus sp.]